MITIRKLASLKKETALRKSAALLQGFEVDLAWLSGKLSTVTIKSLAGQPCRVQYGDFTHTFETRKNKTYIFNGELKVL